TSSSINQAKTLNNHIWVVSFDIAKAFDSVPLDSLHKAMDRISLPSKFKNISLNLLTNRTIEINLNSYSSDKFQVDNGIKQGETLAPLWWVIFYDPLISRLFHSSPEIKFNVLAYMDDLAILGNKHDDLKKDMDIFANFLEINGIKCNAEKTKIIYTGGNKSSKRNLSFDLLGTNLTALAHKQPLRYLDCYFSGFNPVQATSFRVLRNLKIHYSSKKLEWSYSQTSGSMDHTSKNGICP